MNIMVIQVECFVLVKPPVKVNNLIDATYESMMRAINLLKPGLKLVTLDMKYNLLLKKKATLLLEIFVVME